MQRMIMMAVVGGSALLIGCGTGDRDATVNEGAIGDSPVGQTTTAGGEAATLADVAGRWSMRAVPETGADTTATLYTLTATTDRTGWTITFPGREPVPARVVTVGGDSVVTEAGPYESARRPGVQVNTRTTFRREGDRLVGRTVARYMSTGADTVLTLRTDGTRMP